MLNFPDVWDDCCEQYRDKAKRYKSLKGLDHHHPLISPVVSKGTQYLYGRDGDAFAKDGWDTAFDVAMYESYVLPDVARTMDSANLMLDYPMDWQLLWVMGELSDMQDLGAAESPSQAKVMNFLQVIAGVVGQVWFVWSDSTPRQLLDAAAESGAQLNALTPAICSAVTEPSAITTTSPSWVHATTLPMVGSGCWAVIVANTAATPTANASITVALPTARDSSNVTTLVPFELNRPATAVSNGTRINILEPLPAYGTQVYFMSQDPSSQLCLWEAKPKCAKSNNMLQNCGFEAQHIVGVPDQWLLQMVAMGDPYAGAADPFAAMATDAAFTHSGWYSLRYTSSKPESSRLRCGSMRGLSANTTFDITVFAAALTRKTPVSLLIVLEQGTGEFTPLVLLDCPLNRSWTRCHVRFTTSSSATLHFQMSSAGTVWLDDAVLTPICNRQPLTPPARTWTLSTSVTSSFWRFTVVDSWNADGSFTPEPKLGEGPCVKYVQLQAKDGSWITDASGSWSISGRYHNNGPISNLIDSCSAGFWNVGGTTHPWAATINTGLPEITATGFRFGDEFSDENGHLRSFTLESGVALNGTVSRWQSVLNITGLPNNRSNRSFT